MAEVQKIGSVYQINNKKYIYLGYNQYHDLAKEIYEKTDMEELLQSKASNQTAIIDQLEGSSTPKLDLEALKKSMLSPGEFVPPQLQNLSPTNQMKNLSLENPVETAMILLESVLFKCIKIEGPQNDQAPVYCIDNNGSCVLYKSDSPEYKSNCNQQYQFKKDATKKALFVPEDIENGSIKKDSIYKETGKVKYF
jgi:hypothetical protein